MQSLTYFYSNICNTNNNSRRQLFCFQHHLDNNYIFTSSQVDLFPPKCPTGLPERAPANVTLTEVFMGCSLFNKKIHLFLYINWFLRGEISPCQLGSHLLYDTDGFLVEVLCLWCISASRLTDLCHGFLVTRVGEFRILEVVALFLAVRVAGVRTLCFWLCFCCSCKQL